MSDPILYSFRRCPYAMRARLAIASAGIRCELREIVLRDKAPEFLAASPKGTVPVLIVDGKAIEESIDIMQWALAQNDPECWLDMPSAGTDLITSFDGPFKAALDQVKYASRHPDMDVAKALDRAVAHLNRIEDQLKSQAWLFEDKASLADLAILPFVRQFAYVDRPWFDIQPWPNLRRWLDDFLASDRFSAIMDKYPKWQAGDRVTYFGATG